MAKLTLDLNNLDVTSFDPTPAGEDQADVFPILVGTILVGAGLAALSDAYC
ncbi:MAG TPA: hypothetical protein VHG91_06280 [Longimicrobium sp.]|nr:hypothetical protein [Longimicrobium sp.]